MAGRQARREHAGLAARLSGPMKIALVWNGPVALDRISFRHENYQAGWTALGHDAVLVTARDLVGSFSGRTHLVARRDELDAGRDLERHRRRRRRRRDLAPACPACSRRSAPPARAWWRSPTPTARSASPPTRASRGCASAPTSRASAGRLRALRYFCRRFAASAARRDPEELEFVASTRASDRVVLGSAPAIACFTRFLRQQRAGELAAKLREVPFAVPDSFCSPSARAPRRTASSPSARWSDPQKDAALLAAALAEFFARRRATEVVDLRCRRGARLRRARAARAPSAARRHSGAASGRGDSGGESRGAVLLALGDRPARRDRSPGCSARRWSRRRCRTSRG